VTEEKSPKKSAGAGIPKKRKEFAKEELLK